MPTENKIEPIPAAAQEPPLNEREKAFYTAFAAVIGLTMLVMFGLVFGLSHSPLVN